MHKHYGRPIEDLGFSSLEKSDFTRMPDLGGFHPEIRDSVLAEHHKKCSPLVWPPPLAKAAAASHQIPNTEKNYAPSFHYNQYTSLSLQTSVRSHHDFLHLFQYHRNLYLDMSHGTDKKAKLRTTPLGPRP
jgi:hypothetical protein